VSGARQGLGPAGPLAGQAGIPGRSMQQETRQCHCRALAVTVTVTGCCSPVPQIRSERQKFVKSQNSLSPSMNRWKLVPRCFTIKMNLIAMPKAGQVELSKGCLRAIKIFAKGDFLKYCTISLRGFIICIFQWEFDHPLPLELQLPSLSISCLL
jgi:hypothetical protein